MMEYIVNMFLGLAAFFVLLLMNMVIIYKIFSHKEKFTGILSKLYHNLGIFFMVLFFLQLIFPLYITHLNFLRSTGLASTDTNIIFLERIYLGLFLLISVVSFYVAARLLDDMDKLVSMFSFSEKPGNPKEMKLRDLYFTPKEKK